jgi:hypothetical protein
MTWTRRFRRYLSSIRGTGNHAGATNIVVARNITGSGKVHASSHHQTVRIRQNGRESDITEINEEEAETSDG